MTNKYNGYRYKYGMDLLLSYWIFVWYVLYMAGAPVSSPKLALLCAVCFNGVNLINMIYKRAPFIRIVMFIIVQTLIKIIPIYTLRKVTIDWRKDVIILLAVCVLYIGWVHLNDTGVYDIYIARRLAPITDIILDYMPQLRY